MSTRKALLSEFDKMESERKAIIAKMKLNAVEILDQKPAPNAWSVTEAIMHLVVAETGALKYMNKKLEYGGHQKASFSAGVKQRFLNLAVALPFKYKAPKVAQIQEGSNISFEDADKQWIEIRAALRDRYLGLDEAIIDHELFKHPAAGKLSIMQSVRFMRQHMNRHIKQMNDTINQVS